MDHDTANATGLRFGPNIKKARKCCFLYLVRPSMEFWNRFASECEQLAAILAPAIDNNGIQSQSARLGAVRQRYEPQRASL